MNKTVKIMLIAFAVVVAVVAILAAVFMVNSKQKTNLAPVNSSEELSTLVDKIYEEINIELPMVQSQEMDVTQADMVAYVTGLEDGTKLEYLVVSEPLMTSQPYSLVLAKVKSGVDANQIAKEMSEKVDMAKWICVEAEKLYATSSGNIVCLVMSSEDTATAIYEKFKTLAGNVNEVYEKTPAPIELPPEMY